MAWAHRSSRCLLQQDIDREAVLLKDTFEFFQRIHLDLADTLAGHANLLADLFQRPAVAVGQPEALLEDCALALGQALDEALGERRGIERFGHAYVPMDEALGFVALDFSGRPYTIFQAEWATPAIGHFPTDLVQHFFESVAVHAKLTLHAKVDGRNDHHKAEALFKALTRALRTAVALDPRRTDVASTKGTVTA